MIVQVVDACEVGREVLVFARTQEGQAVCVHIHGTPFVLQLEVEGSITQADATALALAMDKELLSRMPRRCLRTNCGCGAGSEEAATYMTTRPCMYVQREDERAVLGATIVMRKPMIGFTADPKPFIEFSLSAAYYAAPAEKFLYEFISAQNWHTEVYSTLKDATLAFLYASVALDTTATLEDGATGVAGGAWIEVEGPPPARSISTCEVEIQTDFANVRVIKDRTANAPHRLMCIDIETCGLLHRSERMVYSISYVGRVKWGAQVSVNEVHIWGGEGVEPDPKYTTVVWASEEEMLRNFCTTIQAYDPDFVAGYNSNSFDFPYLFARAKELGVNIGDFSRVKAYKSSLLAAVRESNAGKKTTTFFDVPGRVIMDALRIVEEAKKLPLYTLKHVASELLPAEFQKEDMPWEEITPAFYGSPQDRARLCSYNFMDSLMVDALIDKMDSLKTLGNDS